MTEFEFDVPSEYDTTYKCEDILDQFYVGKEVVFGGIHYVITKHDYEHMSPDGIPQIQVKELVKQDISRRELMEFL